MFCLWHIGDMDSYRRHFRSPGADQTMAQYRVRGLEAYRTGTHKCLGLLADAWRCFFAGAGR